MFLLNNLNLLLDGRRSEVQADVDDQPLQPSQFMIVHPDAGRDLQPAHEHGQGLAADARGGDGAREGQGG